jgi:hypothetical protein
LGAPKIQRAAYFLTGAYGIPSRTEHEKAHL